MPRGTSGRIVIEVNPELKDDPEFVGNVKECVRRQKRREQTSVISSSNERS